MTEKKKILVAMSGGVDSSVAASLLAQEGHDVIGVTLRLLPRGGEGFGCCGSPDDVSLAKRSADKAGIPHYVLDYSPEFEEKVINYFVFSYLGGETPNPCLACNRYIKFDKLKTFGESIGASHLATGHYARIRNNPETNSYHLFEAVDPSKDQSYVLYNCNQTGLASTLFPVGDTPKVKIRELAHQFQLPNADKKDSQEICFVPKKDYRAFVQNKILEKQLESPTAQPGPILDTAGKHVGTHNGVAYYTIGQRNGLGLQTQSQDRMYVTKIESNTNTLVVGGDRDSLCQGLKANDWNWISGKAPASEFKALVKIRYKHEPTPCLVQVDSDQIKITFDIPQRAVAPGQAAVIYKWNSNINAREVLGGGKITHAL